MSRRLQVILDDVELEEIQRAAERAELTLSEWVRRALREARGRQPSRSEEAKLEAVRAASAHRFPTADIERMLAEIEGGYLDGSPR
jgi:hypothetical protein